MRHLLFPCLHLITMDGLCSLSEINTVKSMGQFHLSDSMHDQAFGLPHNKTPVIISLDSP